tara:strand:+ start:1663 stop:1920 length:258 start_codon:yes stop_codon:yes gene_type:complete
MNIINESEDITEFEGNKGKIRRKLVHYNGEFYIVSENTVVKETLIFPATPTGEITSWGELGGGKGCTLEEVLSDFVAYLHTGWEI